MASIGLDSFLCKDEKRLVDLEWLDIKEDDYENLPFDPVPHYIAEPKLVEEWTHEEDSSDLNLVPNSDFNFNYNMPDKSKMSSDVEKDVAKLLNITAKEMMSGKTGSELVSVIREKSNPQVITAAKELLQSLAKEQGLLGSVYIDPTVFASCLEGSNFVAKKAKTAKYVKSMSSCSTCVHNDCGRCGVYKKRLASEINYDSELLNFYSKHISSLLGETVTIQSKDELQRAFTSKKENKPKIAENKPQINRSKKDKEDTLNDKKEQLDSQIEDLKEDLSKVLGNKISRDISSMMVQKYSSKVIKDHITNKYSSEEFNQNKDIFNDLLSKQGTLGKVYVEAEMLPQDLSLDGISEIKFIILKPKSLIRQHPGFGMFKNKCRGKGVNLIPSIMDIPKGAFESEFKKYPTSITSKVSSIFNKDPIKGIRLAYLQSEIISKKAQAPINGDNFELKSKLDNTSYEPSMDKKASISPKKIIIALDNGYTLTSIVKMGRKLGIEDSTLKANFKEAFNSLSSIHKRQLDLPVTLPSSVEIKISQKDISFDLEKPISEHNAHDLTYNSSSAPMDTLVNDLGVKDSNLDLNDVDKKSADIEISGMSEFTIG